MARTNRTLHRNFLTALAAGGAALMISAVPLPFAGKAFAATTSACGKPRYSDMVEIDPSVVNPDASDKGIKGLMDCHIVSVPSKATKAKAKLFLMINGTNTLPETYQDILRVATQHDYYAIGIAYPNLVGIETVCGPGKDDDDDCSANLRSQIIEGTTDGSSRSPDSIIQRLTDLLVYLNDQDNSAGWDQFLTLDSSNTPQVNWSKITVAGHSQGAGHAAYLAKIETLDRVALFSGVGDRTGDNKTAPWLSNLSCSPNDAFKTDCNNMYAFTHDPDELIKPSHSEESWEAMKIPGDVKPITFDGVSVTIPASHRLTTDIEPRESNQSYPEHMSTVADLSTPQAGTCTVDKRADCDVYKPVWEYMAFP